MDENAFKRLCLKELARFKQGHKLYGEAFPSLMMAFKYKDQRSKIGLPFDVYGKEDEDIAHAAFYRFLKETRPEWALIVGDVNLRAEDGEIVGEGYRVLGYAPGVIAHGMYKYKVHDPESLALGFYWARPLETPATWSPSFKGFRKFHRIMGQLGGKPMDNPMGMALH